MLKYVTLGVHDLKKSKAFYAAVLKPIGIVKLKESENGAGFGPKGGDATLWILYPNNKQPASYGNGTMIALQAPSRKAVNEVHKIALAKGGYDDGKPGIRGGADSNWYACYIRDLTGNKISVVCDKPV